MRNQTRFILACLALLCLAVTACATPKQAPLPVGNLRLGVAQFTQPASSAEMLAGFMPENTPRIDAGILRGLDTQFAGALAQHSKHAYTSAEKARTCYLGIAKEDAARQAAIRTWAAVGRCMGVDLLLVPQVLQWQERQGSNIGVTVPAGVAMDFFIVDVNSETLISRSHFEEVQIPLNENLLNAGAFLRRGGRWVPTSELAAEAMQQAIRELGL